LASRECLNESDDGDGSEEYEEKNLMSKVIKNIDYWFTFAEFENSYLIKLYIKQENVSDRSRDPELSLEEVHARLVSLTS
jgi:hypothetical protein